MQPYFARGARRATHSAVGFKAKSVRRSACKSFVEKIIEQLAIRFEHRAEIVALDIFDPRSIPRDRSEAASYGNKELRSLFDFYVMRRTVKKKGGVRSQFEAPIKGSYSVLEFEWTLLKNELFSLIMRSRRKSMPKRWRHSMQSCCSVRKVNRGAATVRI